MGGGTSSPDAASAATDCRSAVVIWTTKLTPWMSFFARDSIVSHVSGRDRGAAGTDGVAEQRELLGVAHKVDQDVDAVRGGSADLIRRRRRGIDDLLRSVAAHPVGLRRQSDRQDPCPGGDEQLRQKSADRSAGSYHRDRLRARGLERTASCSAVTPGVGRVAATSLDTASGTVATVASAAIVA